MHRFFRTSINEKEFWLSKRVRKHNGRDWWIARISKVSSKSYIQLRRHLHRICFVGNRITVIPFIRAILIVTLIRGREYTVECILIHSKLSKYPLLLYIKASQIVPIVEEEVGESTSNDRYVWYSRIFSLVIFMPQFWLPLSLHDCRLNCSKARGHIFHILRLEKDNPKHVNMFRDQSCKHPILLNLLQFIHFVNNYIHPHIAQNIAETCQKYFRSFITIEI